MSAPPLAGETIVYLDSNYHPLPATFFPAPHTYTPYPYTPLPLIPSRIKPASILLTSLCPLTREILSALPPGQLKLIIITSVGTNHVDLTYCSKNGIQVSNMPDTNTETVAEHAIALYFAVKRDVVNMHEWTMRGENWGRKGTGILDMNTLDGGGARGCKNEVVGIVGGGKIGTAISDLCKALGMKILISERKSLPKEQTRPGRTCFSEILTQCTTIILSCPLSPTTQNLISASEFSLMRHDAILINVARGGVVNEGDLADALDRGEILGAATDVFGKEPVERGESALIRGEGEQRVRNLIVSPHVAWFGRESQEKCVKAVGEIFEGFLRGDKVNCVA
ncbi:hypothetical protein OCU04_011623 [Sclerotinia nivalis]|uniref:Glycerate dehydrogenase n=1 Tax=Sclerotinia nivalis TaxID=352851 RepID=A0A9X0AC53_9HELO|nr:hypothetical protein OCU04_011623 [Sclerotinia nivalis]